MYGTVILYIHIPTRMCRFAFCWSGSISDHQFKRKGRVSRGSSFNPNVIFRYNFLYSSKTWIMELTNPKKTVLFIDAKLGYICVSHKFPKTWVKSIPVVFLFHLFCSVSKLLGIKKTSVRKSAWGWGNPQISPSSAEGFPSKPPVKN